MSTESLYSSSIHACSAQHLFQVNVWKLLKFSWIGQPECETHSFVKKSYLRGCVYSCTTCLNPEVPRSFEAPIRDPRVYEKMFWEYIEWFQENNSFDSCSESGVPQILFPKLYQPKHGLIAKIYYNRDRYSRLANGLVADGIYEEIYNVLWFQEH